jgi:hypothetical protein
VDLRAQAVVFVLRHDRPHLRHDGLGGGEPFGELRVDRFADLDVQSRHRTLGLFRLRMFPERPRDEPQVRGLVVGPL